MIKLPTSAIERERYIQYVWNTEIVSDLGVEHVTLRVDHDKGYKRYDASLSLSFKDEYGFMFHRLLQDPYITLAMRSCARFSSKGLNDFAEYVLGSLPQLIAGLSDTVKQAQAKELLAKIQK